MSRGEVRACGLPRTPRDREPSPALSSFPLIRTRLRKEGFAIGETVALSLCSALDEPSDRADHDQVCLVRSEGLPSKPQAAIHRDRQGRVSNARRSHQVGYDVPRTRRNPDVVFPLALLRRLARDGTIGAVAAASPSSVRSPSFPSPPWGPHSSNGGWSLVQKVTLETRRRCRYG